MKASPAPGRAQPAGGRQWSVSLRNAPRRVGRWIWSVRRLMLLAGALLVLAFPDPNWEFLAWFGLVPGLVLIVRSPTAREGGMRAWWLGAGYLIAALYWMAPEIGPGVLLVAAVFGVLWVPFGVAAQKLLRPPLSWPRALAALVVVPSCWLLTEWLRSWQALGGPWAVFGVSQWQHPAILALAAVGGMWLISFVLVLANVAIVLLLTTLPRVGAAVLPGSSWRGGLAAAGVAAVRPRLLAAAAPQALAAELSRSGRLAGVKPDLIVWGESSIGVDLTLPKDAATLRQF